MIQVRISGYSTFHDQRSKAQFSPELDHRTGLYIGIAHVASDDAKLFEGRPGFDILTDDEYAAMTTPAAAPDPTGPITGDPLTDPNAQDSDPNAQGPADFNGDGKIDDLEALSRMDLVALATLRGALKANNTKSAHLVEFIRQADNAAAAALNGPPPPPGA